jgi:hypothetical protein
MTSLSFSLVALLGTLDMPKLESPSESSDSCWVIVHGYSLASSIPEGRVSPARQVENRAGEVLPAELGGARVLLAELVGAGELLAELVGAGVLLIETGVTSLEELEDLLDVIGGKHSLLLLAALNPLEIIIFFGDAKRLPKVRDGNCDTSPFGK